MPARIRRGMARRLRVGEGARADRARPLTSASSFRASRAAAPSRGIGGATRRAAACTVNMLPRPSRDCDGERSAVRLHDPLADREAEPEAAALATRATARGRRARTDRRRAADRPPRCRCPCRARRTRSRRRTRASRDSSTRPPRGVYLIAFVTRFRNSCRSRVRSPITIAVLERRQRQRRARRPRRGSPRSRRPRARAARARPARDGCRSGLRRRARA